MMLVVIWLVASFAVGAMAPSRNRSYFGWTILSLFISPLLSVLLLIAAGTKPARIIEEAPKRDPLEAMTRPSFEPEPVTIGDRIEDGRRMLRNSRWGFPIFLAVICLAFWGLYRLAHQRQPEEVQADQVQLLPKRSPLIIVPEPEAAAQGILLDGWARSHAPLVPLN